MGEQMDYSKLPQNSHKSKENNKSEPKEIEHRVKQPVTKGTIRKENGFQKIAKSFVPEDLTSVGNDILSQIIIPHLKRMALDSFTRFIGMDVRDSGRSSASYYDYNRRSRDDSKNNVRDYRSDAARNGVSYADLTYDTYAKARSVLSAMDDILEQYGIVRIGDLYDLSDQTANSSSVWNYGWSNLRDAEVVSDIGTGRYRLKLPKAFPIDN